jgi:dihydroflavonol-4-reductase
VSREKVLVTGANGLLGANVVRQLAAMGYAVRAMVRKGSDIRSLKEAEFELFEGAITDEKDVYNAVSGCDFIVHSAAGTALLGSKPDAFLEINVKATRTLLEAGRHYKVKRFIFVSTANCFTNGSIEDPGDETTGFMPWLKDSGYAYSKYLAQQEVMRYVREYGFPAIIVAPTFMIGPYDSKPSSGTLLLLGYNNRIVFYPPGGKSFVDVEHAARAIGHALTKGRTGESYLLAGTNLTYRDFFRMVAKCSGEKKILIKIPRVALMAAGIFSDIIGRIFSLDLQLSSVNARLLALDNYFTNRKAKTELGLMDTDIDRAVSKAVRWFSQNGYLKK